jgi:two-component system response regulator GlrR
MVPPPAKHINARLSSMGSPKILIVDDDESVRYLFNKKLERKGFVIEEASSCTEVLNLIKHVRYRAILLDNRLGDMKGLDIIPQIKEISPSTKIVILTGFGTIEEAVRAMRVGASGFLMKSDLVDYNVMRFCEILDLPGDVSKQVYDFSNFGMIGNSEPMQDLFKRIAKLSRVDTTVLVQGESGTGKELIANAIHRLSPRAEFGPFLAINCAALNENLLEAELFGYRKGSFTDAKTDREGYFVAGAGGTIFLDEIGEMPLNMQAKLLRVLQEKEVTPVGSCKPVKVNTRIVAATNRDLKEYVAAGKFREDLYFRLAVVKVFAPPLRERLDDLPILLEHFIGRANVRYQKQVALPGRDFVNKLKSYPWPGNVRELENTVESAVLMADECTLGYDDLGLQGDWQRAAMDAAITFQSLEFMKAKDEFECSYITSLLKAAHGNIAEAARISGQYRPAIYRLIKKFNIDPNEFKLN